jgi:FXSXX-COOH protein
MDSTRTREPDHDCELPDVSGVPLAELLSACADRPVLANAVRRVVDELAADYEIVAGHSDAVVTW